MNFLGLSMFEIITTVVLLLLLGVGLIGLKIRREQLSFGPTGKKRKAIEQRSEAKRIKQEEDELAALMFNSDESYDD